MGNTMPRLPTVSARANAPKKRKLRAGIGATPQTLPKCIPQSPTPPQAGRLPPSRRRSAAEVTAAATTAVAATAAAATAAAAVAVAAMVVAARAVALAVCTR